MVMNHLSVVLIFVFLLINDVEHLFSCVFGPFVCLLQRNAFSSPLFIFKSDCLACFFCLVVEVLYIYFDICFLSDICFQYFLPLRHCLCSVDCAL